MEMVMAVFFSKMFVIPGLLLTIQHTREETKTTGPGNKI
jgi:hypothetical protein